MDNILPHFVSVIIPVFNDKKRLKLCLISLQNQTYPQDLYEVIVVDNGSDESVEDLVNQFSQAFVTYESDRGSYAARNKGISISRGELLAFTDSDCIPAPNWLEMGIKQLISTSNCGLVAGKIEIFFKDPGHPTAAEVYDAVTNLQQKKYVQDYNYGATANLFTFKKVFEQVGYFDSSLKSGGDAEWGLRVHSQGYSLIYAEDSCVVHSARYSLAQLTKKIIRQTGGTWDRQKNKSYTWKQIIKNLLRLKPPLRSAFRKAHSNQILKNNRQKLELFGVIIFLHYVKVLEEIRLQLGGKSRR